MAETAFPVGQTYQVDFGSDLVFQLRFDSERAMQFIGMAGQNEGRSSEERIKVSPLQDGVFLISWQDGGGNTFIQVNDFQRGAAYLELTLPDNLEETNTRLIHLEGPLQLVEAFEEKPA